MTIIDDQGRPEPPFNAGEGDTLIGFLEYQRATLRWKCERIDSAGMNTTVAASTMTLGGLLKHMAWVEDHWFSYVLHGRDRLPMWTTVDWNAEPNWEWESAALDDASELRRLWEDAVAHSQADVDTALTSGDGLDQVAVRGRHGGSPNLRWIIVHMIEEYARHNGHADLIREAIDGETGE